MITLDIWYIDEGFLVWIIPSTYLSHETVNWVCTAGFAIFAFINFYFRFLVLFLLLYYNCLHPALPLVFYSTNLLLSSYYTMRILCLISLVIFLLAHVCWCSQHDFLCMYDSDLLIHVCLSLHAIWHSHHH